MKKILRAFGDLVSPNDPELIEKTLTRIDEQDKWNDVFSTKLIELLDNIDLLKAEIRQRMRTAESATQTALASLEGAERAHQAAAESTLEAKRLLDQATSQLEGAQQRASEAAALAFHAEECLTRSDRKLTESHELDRAAEQKRLSAVRLLKSAVRCSSAVISMCWTATIWLAWLVLRPGLPILATCAASVIAFALPIVLVRQLVKKI